MKKRILAILIAGMMGVTLIPAEVFAAEPIEQAEEFAGETEEQPEEELLSETEQEDLDQEEAASEERTETGNNETSEETAVKQEEAVEETANKEDLEENKRSAEEITDVRTTDTEEKTSEDKGIEMQAAEAAEENLLNRPLPAGGLEKTKEIELTEAQALAGAEEEGISAEGSQKYDSSWDIYSSNYVYNKLNSSEKKYWDALDLVGRRYLTTNIDAMPYDEDTAYSRYYIYYEKCGLTLERAKEVFLLFCYANPQYYFLMNGYMYGNYQGERMIAPTIYSAFAIGTTRASYTAEMKSQINAMVSKVSKGSNDVQKAQIAHDLIIKKVNYEPGWPNSMMTPYHQSAFSVFCTDYTVCAGYTKAFEILMNGAGVDTMGVTSPEHAWNKVCINDSWYNVDLTWDDLDGYGGEDGYYMYFNRSDAMITGEYLEQGTTYHQMEAIYAGKVPKCTLDSGITVDTLFTIGTYKNPSATVQTPAVKLDKSSKKNIKVTLSSESGAEIYYTLDGVNPSSSYSKSYYYKKPFTVNSNVNLKVIAVKNTKKDSKIVSKKVYGKVYTVKFNSVQGSKVSSQKIYANDKLKKPSNPKRSGYVFAGWYKDSKYKSAWNFNSKVTKNTTLYAKWAKKCTVKFDANKGSVKTKSKSVGYKEMYGTMPQAVRRGYSFSGWYTKKSGGKKITEKSKVTTTKTTTLYARWKKVTVSKAAVSKVTNTSGLKMTVAIKKVSGAKGYQIKYSVKSNMKPAKTTSISGTKKTITKLSKGKKYYVQVRAYKIDSGGKKVYGAWSAKKSVIIKK